MDTALAQVAATLADFASSSSAPQGDNHFGSKARTPFQWGGTVSVLFLLVLNRTGRCSSMQSSLLVFFLFASFPTVLFNILRGQFGCWVALVVVMANLFFPEQFPVSRFLLFVITPDWLANLLRGSIIGGIICLIIGLSLGYRETRGVGGCSRWECNVYCLTYIFATLFLFFFTILYISSGPW